MSSRTTSSHESTPRNSRQPSNGDDVPALCDRVRFPFGDAVLEGAVVAAEPKPQFDDRDAVLLTVATHHGRYRVRRDECARCDD